METASSVEPGELFLEIELSFFLSLEEDGSNFWVGSPVRGQLLKVRNKGPHGLVLDGGRVVGVRGPAVTPFCIVSCLFFWGTWLCPQLPMSSSWSRHRMTEWSPLLTHHGQI